MLFKDRKGGSEGQREQEKREGRKKGQKERGTKGKRGGGRSVVSSQSFRI